MTTRQLVALAYALLAALSFAAHSAEPGIDQPAARSAAIQFLDALSTGSGQDPSALSESLFAEEMHERVGTDRLVDIVGMLSEDFAGLDAKNAVREVSFNDDRWDVLVVNEFGQRYMFGLSFSETDGAKVSALMVKHLPTEVAAVAPNDIADTVDKYLVDVVENKGFSGAVLLAKHNDVIYAKAFGLADTQANRPNTLDTPINLGSMNKMFTSLLIGQLVSKGTVNWDDKVGQHLADLPNKRIRDEVTLHQLLTHTSGVGSYWNQAYDEKKQKIDSLDGFLATFIDEPLLFEPGTDNAYSNGGPVILGLIIEKYTDMSYYDAVRKYVYGPAGMQHSDHYQTNDAASGIAVGYFPGDDGLVSNGDDLGLMGSPAGGGYASANDMLKFSNAIATGRLLDQATLDQIWTPYEELGPDFGYGYLWGTGNIGGQRWVGHNGGAPGISADYRYYPASGVTIVVLANRDRVAQPVSDWLNQLVSQSGE